MGGFLLTCFSSFGQTFFVSASIAEWQSAFDLRHGEIGRLYMSATLASAVCLPFLGRIVDVVPEHKTIMIVVPVLAAATLLGAIWPEVYGTEHLGAIRSVIVSAMVLSTAAGPGVTGTLIDNGVALGTQFSWLGVYCLCAALAMGFASVKLSRRIVAAAA